MHRKDKSEQKKTEQYENLGQDKTWREEQYLLILHHFLDKPKVAFELIIRLQRLC